MHKPSPHAARPPAHTRPLPARVQVLPRLALQLAGWSPLAAPAAPTSEFAVWRPLLESEGARRGVLGGVGGAAAAAGDLSALSDPYARLVAETVLPPLRKELVQGWDPRCALQPCAAPLLPSLCAALSCLLARVRWAGGGGGRD